MNRLRPVLGTHRHPAGGRPPAHSREYVYLCGGQPEGRNLCLPNHAGARHGLLQIFLDIFGEELSQGLDPVLWTEPAITTRRTCNPANISPHLLPPLLAGAEPQENLWDEIREKIFKNSALISMDEVYAKLEEAASYIECNPKLVKSITSFPYIAGYLIWKWYQALSANWDRDDDRRIIRLLR